jgi:hypothetical protein
VLRRIIWKLEGTKLGWRRPQPNPHIIIGENISKPAVLIIYFFIKITIYFLPIILIVDIWLIQPVQTSSFWLWHFCSSMTCCARSIGRHGIVTKSANQLNGLVKTKVVIEHAEGIALAVDQK